MWIEHGNHTATLTRADDKERTWLRDFLSFRDVNARFRRGNSGDGRVHMFNYVTETFPAGFIPMVRKAARDASMTVEVIDQRIVPALIDPDADLDWLRDYQRESFDKVLERKRGILWLSTGAGKTEIAVAVARAIPTPALFIVHRTSLGDQAAKRFAMRNAEHGIDLGAPGIIGEGQWTEGERFTAATFQTLAAALKKGDPRAEALLKRVGVMFVDECHVLPAESFWKVAMACDAYYRVGLSGTPLDRDDRRSILAIAALGPVIHRVKAETLVERGVLAKPKVRMATVPQTASGHISWAAVYGEKVVRSAPRNKAIVDLADRATKPSFCFVKEVEHGKELEKRMLKAGIRAEFVWGAHSTRWRASVVNKLQRGAIDVLICSVIFQEGIDVPELRSVINAAGSKSVIATLQKLGRGMRIERDAAGKVKEGGDVFELWDIMDVGNTWLERHSKARKHAYVAEGHETIIEPAGFR